MQALYVRGRADAGCAVLSMVLRVMLPSTHRMQANRNGHVRICAALYCTQATAPPHPLWYCCFTL